MPRGEGGGTSAGTKRERRRREEGEEDTGAARLPLQSRVRPHSFICSVVEVLNLVAERVADHPPSAFCAPLVYGSCLVHCARGTQPALESQRTAAILSDQFSAEEDLPGRSRSPRSPDDAGSDNPVAFCADAPR